MTVPGAGAPSDMNLIIGGWIALDAPAGVLGTSTCGTPLGVALRPASRVGYLVAQAERVTGGVDQHSPAMRAWLCSRSSRSQGDGGPLAVIEIGDRELEVQLLGDLPGWPLRRAMLRDALHGDQHGSAA